MTNFEQIKKMSVEEMAEWIEDIFSSNPCYCCVKKDINKCHYYEKNYYDRMALCVESREKWLNSQVQE